jgi:hypothetical protein
LGVSARSLEAAALLYVTYCGWEIAYRENAELRIRKKAACL